MSTNLRQALQDISTHTGMDRLSPGLQEKIRLYVPERVDCRYSYNPWGTRICNWQGECTACLALQRSAYLEATGDKPWERNQLMHPIMDHDVRRKVYHTLDSIE